MKIWWYAFKYHHPNIYYFLRGWAWYCVAPGVFAGLMCLGAMTEKFVINWKDFSPNTTTPSLIFGLAGVGLLTALVLILFAIIFIGAPILIGETNYRLQYGPLNSIIQKNREEQKSPAFHAWIRKYQVHSDTEGFLYQIPESIVKEITQNRYQEPFTLVKVLNPTPLPDGTREEFYLHV